MLSRPSELQTTTSTWQPTSSYSTEGAQVEDGEEVEKKQLKLNSKAEESQKRAEDRRQTRTEALSAESEPHGHGSVKKTEAQSRCHSESTSEKTHPLIQFSPEVQTVNMWLLMKNRMFDFTSQLAQSKSKHIDWCDWHYYCFQRQSKVWKDVSLGFFPFKVCVLM